MPVEPNLSLDLTPIGQTTGGGLASSLGLVGQFAQIQNALNQNRMFGQTFAAQQKLGQIMAQAPDLETGLATAGQDPDVAGFAGAALGNMRALQQTMVATQGMQATQAKSGLDALYQGIASTASNPSMLPSVVKSIFATLSPYAKSTDAGPIANVLKSIMPEGDPSDPTYQTQYRKNLGALAASGALNATSMEMAFGKPGLVNQGNQQQPTLTSPSTGQVSTIGSPFGTGAPAGYKDVNGVPVGVPAIGSGGPPAQGNGLSPPPALSNQPNLSTDYVTKLNSVPSGQGGGENMPYPPPPGNALGSRPPAALASGGNPLSTGPSASADAGDGKPLIPPGTNMAGSPSAAAPKGVAGMPLLSDAQKRLSTDLAAQYGDEDKKTFQGAQGTLGQLQFMDHALDQMAASGGIMVPGTWADARTSLAKAALTAAQMVGSKDLPFDPSTVASVESFNKATAQMGTMLTTSLLGQQREAAQTITRLTGAVPSISNTFLGGKLVSAGIQATMQRIIAQRNFQNAWLLDPANKGDLAGSAEAFNTAHPAEGYAQGVLKQFGLTSKGFASPQDVASAVAKGYLTKEQAKPILQQQFGMQ